MKDLADGARLTHVRFASKRGAGADLTTDGRGVLGHSEDLAESLTPAEPWIRVPGQSSDEVLTHGEIWCYRRIPVSVSVEFPAGFDLAGARTAVAEAWVCGGGPGAVAEEPERPWSVQWLEAHRVSRRMSRLRVDATERFVVEAPRIRGLMVVLRVEGLRPGFARVAVGSGRLEGDAHLRLERSYLLQGRVVDADERPRAGVYVTAYVRQESATRFLDFEPLQALGHGVTLLAGSGGSAEVTFNERVRTDDDGRFRIALNVDGEALVEALSEDAAPARVHLGWSSVSRDDLAIRLGPSLPGAKVRFSWGGAPVSGARVLVADVSLPVGQPAREARSSAETGEVTVHGLEDGHTYYFDVQWPAEPGSRRQISGFLVWNGQEEIRLDRDLERTR